MKKPVLPRLAGLCVVYLALFFAIILIQFARQGGFSRRIGSLELSGHLRDGLEDTEEQPEGGYPLAGEVNVIFAGLNFFLSGEDSDGFVLVDERGERVPLAPELMTVSEDSAHIRLSGGQDLTFYVRASETTGERSEELIISGAFGADTASVEIPFSVIGSAKAVAEEKGNLIVLVNNIEYTFDRPIIDTDKRLLRLSPRDPIVSYKAVLAQAAFNPVEFILSGSMEKTQYTSLVNQWANGAYAHWRTEVQGRGVGEEIVASYVAEAARRDSYSAAVSAIPASFRNSDERTYVTSPFLGGMTRALRSQAASDQARVAELAALLENDPYALFREDHVVEYLAVRGEDDLAGRFAEAVLRFPVDEMTLDLCPAALELWRDTFIWGPEGDNAFAPLVDRACVLIAEALRKDAEGLRIFAAVEDSVDPAFNLRLGAALSVYGEFTGRAEWSAVGRSLVLSVLSLADERGAVPEMAAFTAAGGVEWDDSLPRVPALVLYRWLSLSAFYPHATSLDLPSEPVWLWTVSPAVSAALAGSTLTISVNFPAGETHYLIIRGLRPFTKIQLRGVDYRSDPQFESYNAPGWLYSPQEQALLVKLVQRTENETIKVFF